ncbi:MAG: hypothetical protein V4604_08995 [Bacteroidota bacterium]
MKLKLSFLAIVLVVITRQTTFAQDLIRSEVIKSDGHTTKICSEQSKSFYAYYGGDKSPKLKRYEGFTPISQGELVLKTESGKGSFNSMIMVGDRMVLFFSVEEFGLKKLYSQNYSENCTPEGTLLLIAEYKILKGGKSAVDFKVIQSEDKAFFGVQYPIPGAETVAFGYKTYDAEFNVISDGKREFPYAWEAAEMTNHYLSNTGDLFLGMKIYNTNDKGKVVDRISLKKYLVFCIKDSEIIEMNLDLGYKFITNMVFTSDEHHILTCSGLYGKEKIEMQGLFYLQVDFNDQEIINQTLSNFTVEMGSLLIGKYDFHEIHTTADGSLIVIMEYYSSSTSMTEVGNGSTVGSRDYDHGDVIIYRMKGNGEFEWMKKIEKYQSSINFNSYGSIGGYFKDNEFIMFFNDNIDNYTKTGEFSLGEDGLDYLYFAKKTICLAKVEIDLENGEYTRTRYLPTEETGLFSVPQQFKADYINNELLMYFHIDGAGQKENFGVLKF